MEVGKSISKSHRDVIIRTAKCVRSNGSQFEILLKANQLHSNPLFDFLDPENPEFVYYAFLKALSAEDFNQHIDEISALDSNVLCSLSTTYNEDGVDANQTKKERLRKALAMKDHFEKMANDILETLMKQPDNIAVNRKRNLETLEEFLRPQVEKLLEEKGFFKKCGKEVIFTLSHH